MIQRQLIDKLALKLLEGEFREGDVVQVDAAGGELSFAKAGEPVGRRLAARWGSQRGRCLEHAHRAVEAALRTSSTATLVAGGGHEDHLLGGEAPERVLHRLHGVGVADLSAGVDVRPSPGRPARRQPPLGVEARLPQVGQPVGEAEC